MKTSEKNFTKQIPLFIHTLDHEGRGLGRDADNRVIIVEDALLNSEVLVQIDKEKKNLAFAHVVEVIKKSPFEVEAECESTENCGGCTWQNFDYAEQIKAKQKIINDAFTKIAKYELSNFKINPAEKKFQYRNKMEFTFGFIDDFSQEKENKVIGLKKKNSHNCIKVNCKLCVPLINRVIHRLEQLCLQNNDELPFFFVEDKEAEGFLRHVITRTSQDNTSLLLEIISYPKPEYNQALYQVCRQLKEEFPQITGIVHSTRKNLLPLAFGEKAIAQFGSKQIQENLNINNEKLSLNYGYQSFFQTNTLECSKLYSSAIKLVEKLKIKKFADIFCGVGGIGLSLAHSLKMKNIKTKLVGLEINKQAIEFATKNAEKLEIDADFTLSDAKILSKFLKANKNLDLIILDPPRAGIEKESLQAIVKSKIENILIISCNPATLARDFALLKENYTLEHLEAFDLFPHTPHIESIALLKRIS